MGRFVRGSVQSWVPVRLALCANQRCHWEFGQVAQIDFDDSSLLCIGQVVVTAQFARTCVVRSACEMKRQ